MGTLIDPNHVHFQVVNPFDYPDWNERLASLGDASFFNTVEWARVLSKTYGYEPCYLVGREGGELVSLLPIMHVNSWLTGNRGVALPFSDYCEPVGPDLRHVGLVLDSLKELGRRKTWRYFEIRSDAGVERGCPASAVYRKHSLDLTGGEQALSGRLESSVRTSIRKAIKEGVEVTFARSLEAVREFYGLNCLTRRRHGVPPQPFSFFRNFHQQVLTKGLGEVAIARQGGASSRPPSIVMPVVQCFSSTGPRTVVINA
jgi:hypothetical protein